MEQAPGDGPHAMVRLIAGVIGVGIVTADMLMHEVLSRKLRDRRAVARYGGLTGAPDESGSKRREKGLAKACGPPNGSKRFADPLVRSMTGACKAGLGSTRWRYDCRRQNGRPIGTRHRSQLAGATTRLSRCAWRHRRRRREHPPTRQGCALVVSENWPSAIHSVSAADDKAALSAMTLSLVRFGGMMDCVVAVAIDCAAHTM